MRPFLIFLSALGLWHGDQALEAWKQPVISKPQIVVKPALSLFPCNPEGDIERRRICKAQARMEKVRKL